jgi:hypothetical protein
MTAAGFLPVSHWRKKMKSDYAVQKMPGFGYPASFDQNEKTKRIWQVVLIERDDMGAHVKDLEVRRSNLTHDEASTLWNDLVQELRTTESTGPNKGV